MGFVVAAAAIVAAGVAVVVVAAGVVEVAPRPAGAVMPSTARTVAAVEVVAHRPQRHAPGGLEEVRFEPRSVA
ncbi:hypothetical protein BKA57DRAFT_461678 [Linnemannia elongata]|nr:hypothetical protein BKA57DRAFT_461678 [Linnemannia elongata]